MTFEGWASRHMQSGLDVALAKPIWNAGQAAEREKYYQLIEKAEGVIAAWDNRFGPAMLDTYMETLRDVVEKVKESKQ